jgi:hypothetical protein
VARAPDRGEDAVPVVGDRLSVGCSSPPGKIRVFVGRRELEPLSDGRTAVIELTRAGWVVRGIFDRPSAAAAALAEPRLL